MNIQKEKTINYLFMALNDNKLVSIMGTGDEACAGFHGGGLGRRMVAMSGGEVAVLRKRMEVSVGILMSLSQ